MAQFIPVTTDDRGLTNYEKIFFRLLTPQLTPAQQKTADRLIKLYPEFCEYSIQDTILANLDAEMVMVQILREQHGYSKEELTKRITS